MKRTGLLIFSLLSLFYCAVAQDDVNFRRYSQENGMPAVTLRTIFEDGKGFLWISTEQGIYRYDGYTFKTFKHDNKDPNSILTNKTRIFLSDSFLNPILVMNNSISIYDCKLQKFRNYVHSELLDKEGQNITINAVKNDYKHNLNWFLSNDKLFKFNPVNGNLDIYNIPDPPSGFSALVFSSDTTLLLISVAAPVLYEFSIISKQFRKYPNEEIVKNCLKDSPVMQLMISTATGENVFGRAGIFYLNDRFYIFNTNDPHNPSFYKPVHTNAEYQYMRFNVYGDEIWISTKRGKIISINLKTHQEIVYDVNVNSIPNGDEKTIFDVLKDKDGDVWAITDGLGLIRINPETGKVTQYTYKKDNPNSVWSNSCGTILLHSSGVVWVGFISKGLIKIEKQKKIFKSFIPLNATAKAIASGRQLSSDVRSIYPLDKDRLLVGSLSNLCEVNVKTGDIDFVKNNKHKDIVPSLSQRGLYTAITKDKKGNIYIGTWERKVFVYNPETSFFREYSKNTGYQFYSMGDQSRSLIIDSKNNLWFATDSSIGYINTDNFLNSTPSNIRIKLLPIGLKKKDCITGFPAYCLFEDSKKNVWAGTVKGLNKISQDGKIEQFVNDPENPYSLSENDVRHICEDQYGNIWIATNGGGVNKYDIKTKRFTSFNTTSGLPDDAIYTMAFDKENNLWLSSNRGLAKFDPQTGSVKKFSLYDGLQNYEFNTNAVCKMPGGELVFGGNSGINVFKPEEMIISNIAPKIALSSFKIFNKEVPLPEEGITIPYYDNNLTFEFTALSFYRNEENQYAYMMVNFDKDWIYGGNQHFISYNNLEPGNYTFKVKGSNSAGVWNTKGISYNITILPPWWKTWWARALFAILILAGIFFFIQYRTKSLRIQRAVLEQKVEERTKELKQTQSLLIQQEKLASLGVLTAGIAHEIKNPLNFVTNFSDLSEKLIEEFKTTDSEEDKIDILDDLSKNLAKINKHGHRANSIVENMLQHSRGGKGEVQLTNINPICEEYLDIAFHNARARKPGFDCEIKKNFDTSIPKIKIVPQDISRVLLNFYSNAFDAVKEKQKALVEVSTRQVGDHVEIKIRDNGSGIPDHIKESIFQPFFTTKPSGQGTGLGLSISYDIVKAHGGDIKLDSVENEFTEFIVSLPI